MSSGEGEESALPETLMKSILHDIEYEINGRGESIDKADISPAYAALLEDYAGEPLDDLIDDNILIEELSHKMAGMPTYEDQYGINHYWMAFGASLIDDLCKSLEIDKDDAPAEDDFDGVRLLADKWLEAYRQSKSKEDHTDQLIKKFEEQLNSLMHGYRLNDPVMKPILTSMLAKLVIIDGFETSLVNAIALNNSDDPIQAMKITQNISNALSGQS